MKALATSRRTLSVAIAGAIALASTSHAIAQSSDSEGGALLEEVVVTGSRITRDGYTAPTPVTVATRDELVSITPGSLADGLNKLPQFQMSSSPSRGLHNWPREDSHGNLLNLRALDPVRTLVLLDGMRMPPTNIPGTFDVNVLPSLLMDRVEVVTGGASAAYGADAVAGVVNFVLDKDYEGIKGEIMGGVSDQGDNENARAAIAGGFKFAGDKGHVLFSAETYQNDGMNKDERDYNAKGWMYLNDGAGYRMVPDGRLNLATSYGYITGPAGFSLAGQQILEGGGIAPLNRGTPGGVFTSGGDGFTIPFDTSAVAEQDNQNFFARVSYDFSDDLSGYIQGAFSTSEIRYTSLSNSLNSPASTFLVDNPYLPAGLRDAMVAEGVDRVTIGEYAGDTVKPLTIEETEFFMIGGGLEGRFNDNWSWNLNFTYGESDKTSDQHGQYEWAKVYAAIDVVTGPNGNPVCYATLDPRPEVRSLYADCKPLNVLGGDPAALTPEGYDYASGTSSYNAVYKQAAYQALVSGSLFDMPAGPVDVVFGIEYRDSELNLTSNSDPALLDDFDANGNPSAERDAVYGPIGAPWQRLMPASNRGSWYWLSNQGIAQTEDQVMELMAEINVPIISGDQQLDLSAAYRYTDYDISGDIDTWKVGLQYRPVSDLLFRGTVSRDIRAPSLYDLGRGDSFRIGFLDDPASGTSGNITQVEGASSSLVPEESDTYTLGFVWTPADTNFSLAVDYYSIDIEGAISQGLNVIEVVNRCHDSGGSAPECAQITRPSANAFPTSVRIVSGNFAFLETSGIDIEANYGMELGAGNLSFHLSANFLSKFETQANSVAPVLAWDGIASIGSSVSQGRPDVMGFLNVRYELGDFAAILSQQYIAGMDIDRVGIPTTFAPGEPTSTDDVWYTDLTLQNDFEMGGGNLQAFISVNNLWDEEPPIVPSTLPSSTPVTIIGVYDHIGRTFTAGLRFEF